MCESPIAEWLGYKLISVEPGQAVIELDASRRHTNPFGILHGGVLCTIAGAAMASAYAGGGQGDGLSHWDSTFQGFSGTPDLAGSIKELRRAKQAA